MTRKVSRRYFGIRDSIAEKLVIAFYVAIVVYPCLVGYWPIERAKLYVAQAENTLDKAKEPEDERFREARSLLGKARELDPSIEQNFDYLRILDKIDPVPLERLLPALRHLTPSTRRFVGYSLADDALKRKEFEKSYQILSMVTSYDTVKNPLERNRLAYGAALAKKDLTLALREINAALSEIEVESPMLIDTKAWVLHELHRDEEALEWIERAIKHLNEELAKAFNPNLGISQQEFEALIAPPDSDHETEVILTVSQLKEGIAVKILTELAIYHYHRAEILTSLKQTEKAEKAFDWLENRGFNKFSELY